MGVFIKRTRGLKNINQVKEHIKYVGFRSRELKKDIGFFDKENNNSDYKKFFLRVKKDKALQHPNSVKVQKLIFSLKQKDYDAYLRSGKDYKYLIRNTLNEYEKRNNVKLDWIASVHNVEGHPHVHVIIKAVSDERGIDGKCKRIYFKKEDFKFMKGDFDKEFEREVDYKGFEKLDKVEIDRTLNDISKGFEQVTRQIKRDIKKEQHKSEFKKDKELHDIERKNKERDFDRER